MLNGMVDRRESELSTSQSYNMINLLTISLMVAVRKLNKINF